MTRIAHHLCLIGLTLLASGCGGGAAVETIRATRGPLVESFVEPARTWLPQPRRVHLEVDADLGVITLQPGDPVVAGQELAAVDREAFERRAEAARAAVRELEARLAQAGDETLERSALAGANAEVEAFKGTLKASEAQVEAERLRMDRLEKDLARDRELASRSALTQADLDQTQLDADTARVDWRRQRFYHEALRALDVAIHLGPRMVQEYLTRKHFDRDINKELLSKARAELSLAERDLSRARVLAPSDGVVLARHELGGGPLPAGTALVTIGDPQDLEVIAEVLTEDALRLRAGGEVQLEATMIGRILTGTVARVEPQGFTKLSSLGVEQQRVRVRIDLDETVEGLGVGYRLQARFVTARVEDALKLPRSAVREDPDRRKVVLVVEGGKLAKRAVELGIASDLEIQVLRGVSLEDTVIRSPDRSLHVGDPVSPQ